MARSLTRFSRFDLDDPHLPPIIKKAALVSGGFPYAEKLKGSTYKAELKPLQIELIKLLAWQQKSGARVLALFEGRDAAGKSGSIKAIRRNLNPRFARDRRPVGAVAPGARPMVLPALRRGAAGRRRNGALRPLLVQPRRGRAGDGLLQHSERRPLPDRGAAF